MFEMDLTQTLIYLHILKPYCKLSTWRSKLLNFHKYPNIHIQMMMSFELYKWIGPQVGYIITVGFVIKST